MTTTIPFRWHGDLLHQVGIFLAIKSCNDRGYVVRDPEVFAKKNITPCIPDVWADTTWKFTNQYGRKTQGRKNLIIEIETNATKASILNKWRQYVESTTGLELIVLDLNEVVDHYDVSVEDLWKYVDGGIP